MYFIFKQPCVVAAIIIDVHSVQMGKLRYRELKSLPHNCSVSEREPWDSNPGSRLCSWNATLLLGLKRKKSRLVRGKIKWAKIRMGQARERGTGEGSGRESPKHWILVLIALQAHFSPKSYAPKSSYPLRQSSRLILANSRVPWRAMSQGKPQRQLTMLRKIHHQERTLQNLKCHQPARVASQLSRTRPASGNLRMRHPRVEGGVHVGHGATGSHLETQGCGPSADPTHLRWLKNKPLSSLSLIQTNSRKMVKLRVLPCTFCSIPLLERLLSALRCCEESNL